MGVNINRQPVNNMEAAGPKVVNLEYLNGEV